MNMKQIAKIRNTNPSGDSWGIYVDEDLLKVLIGVAEKIAGML